MGLLAIYIKVMDKKPKYTLEELVDKITPENTHPETDWGPDVGKEIVEEYQPSQEGK
jgi:antitoxin component of MazEF toxin-antitoxin module